MELEKKLDMRPSKNKKYKYRWGLFKCPYCKNNVERILSTGKKLKSCGCKSIELRLQKTIKHGDCDTSLYRVWGNMKGRCYTPTDVSYCNYGRRGVRVCDEWITSYLAFKRWALGNGYKKGLSIDRIDNDGDYCPENCRFVTAAQNNQNQSSTKLTWDKVNEIRDRYVKGKITYEQLGNEFGVDQSHIGKVVRGTTWQVTNP